MSASYILYSPTKTQTHDAWAFQRPRLSSEDLSDEEQPAAIVAPVGRSVEYLCGLLGCMWDYICADLSQYQSTFMDIAVSPSANPLNFVYFNCGKPFNEIVYILKVHTNVFLHDMATRGWICCGSKDMKVQCLLLALLVLTTRTPNRCSHRVLNSMSSW